MNILDTVNNVKDICPKEYQYLFQNIPSIYNDKEYMLYWEDSVWKIGLITDGVCGVDNWVEFDEVNLPKVIEEHYLDVYKINNHLGEIILNTAIIYQDKIKKVENIYGAETLEYYNKSWEDFGIELMKTIKKLTSPIKLVKD